MQMKEEQMYLGDILCANGKHDRNIQSRKGKGLGIIKQIMQILEATVFGKYHFEVALVLRESLFLSSLLLNSEAWVNLKEQDIRKLEQVDEILLSKILQSEANTNNIFKYLELGVIPIRFVIMKRKILFLQYILQQEKSSLIYKVLEATMKNPLKNDFVDTCKKYLQILKIDLSFSEIENLSKWSLKKIVKEKTEMAAFEYLLEQQKKPRKNGKLSKIANIRYDRLELQPYLVGGNHGTKISQFIFKARSQTLDIKTQKKWKYEDAWCTGCESREETGDEILTCEKFGKYQENITKPKYSWFFSDCFGDMVYCAEVMIKRLKARTEILENG